MRIWLDPEKLQGYGLSASEVLAAVRGQNVQFAVGLVRRRAGFQGAGAGRVGLGGEPLQRVPSSSGRSSCAAPRTARRCGSAMSRASRSARRTMRRSSRLDGKPVAAFAHAAAAGRECAAGRRGRQGAHG